MNEDYLWDRTGSDPEIEELEQKLGVFRSGDLQPPSIAGSVPRQPASFLSFGLRLGFASLAAAVIVAFSAVFYFDRPVDPYGITITFNEAPERTGPVEIPDPPSLANADHAVTDARNATREFVRTARTAPKTGKPASPVGAEVPDPGSRNSVDLRPGDQFASLTQEERYAYDQLMLALSISSSRFKMVRDKAEGRTDISGDGAANR